MAVDLYAFFEDLHRHPELSWQEFRTTEKIRDVLTAAGIPLLTAGAETGLVAVIRGALPGKTTGLRCDIDALPVVEQSGLPYASETHGKAHTCGHDFHTTVMLGTALSLWAQRDRLAGTVKVIFQPAEEAANGAEAVVKSGSTDDVECFFALHTTPQLEVGMLGIREGGVMASNDRFCVTFKGVSSHAAEPDKGIDPVVAAAAAVLSLQTLVSRTCYAFTPAVLTVGHIEAGSTYNVMPETALIEGTMRTYDQAAREKLAARFREVIEGTAAAYGVKADIGWYPGCAAVINDGALCGLARRVGTELGFTCVEQENTMTSEDFSAFLRKAPGVFIRVGTGGGYPLHHPKFTADPAAIEPLVRYFTALAIASTMEGN